MSPLVRWATRPPRLPLHPLYRHEEVADGIFRVEEKFFDSWNQANMYYVVGGSQDLLIDTGS